ncbi:MAG: tetratricopeptide repeat protein, partial [Longimicrobiales bacterium]
MMKMPAQADMQRWSQEVARDPRSLSFIPLARAYRKQGLRDASLQLCLRGLEAYPSNVEAHGLLAMLYLDTGEHEKAADEWSMVLRVDPDNFDALRGMGFCFLEQDRLTRARQMLERAALMRPSDPTVQEALRVLGTRQEIAEQGLSSSPAAGFGDDPWAATAASDAGPVFLLEPSASRDEAEH